MYILVPYMYTYIGFTYKLHLTEKGSRLDIWKNGLRIILEIFYLSYMGAESF